MERGPRCSGCSWLAQPASRQPSAGARLRGAAQVRGYCKPVHRVGLASFRSFRNSSFVTKSPFHWRAFVSLWRAGSRLAPPAFPEPLVGVACGAKQLHLLRLKLLGIRVYVAIHRMIWETHLTVNLKKKEEKAWTILVGTALL